MKHKLNESIERKFTWIKQTNKQRKDAPSAWREGMLSEFHPLVHRIFLPSLISSSPFFLFDLLFIRSLISFSSSFLHWYTLKPAEREREREREREKERKRERKKNCISRCKKNRFRAVLDSVFTIWVGELARQKARSGHQESAMREYSQKNPWLAFGQ